MNNANDHHPDFHRSALELAAEDLTVAARDHGMSVERHMSAAREVHHIESTVIGADPSYGRYERARFRLGYSRKQAKFYLAERVRAFERVRSIIGEFDGLLRQDALPGQNSDPEVARCEFDAPGRVEHLESNLVRARDIITEMRERDFEPSEIVDRLKGLLDAWTAKPVAPESQP